MYLNNDDTDSTWKRILPKSIWSQQGTVQLILLSLLAGIMLALMFVTGLLVVDLFVSKGIVVLKRDELKVAHEIYGPALNVVARIDAMNASEEWILQDRGLLHSLWLSKDRIWVKPIQLLYIQVPALRSNNTTLVILLITGGLLGLLRGIVMARCRLLASQIGMNSANQMRKQLHRQVMRIGPSDLMDRETALAYDLFREETSIVRDGIAAHAYRLAVHPISILIVIFLGLSISSRLFIQMAIPLLGCWILVNREQARFDRSKRLVELDAERRSKVLAESLTKTRLIRGYGMEEFDNALFTRLLNQLSTFSDTVMRREVYSRWMCWGLVLGCMILLALLMGVKVILPIEHPQCLQLAEVTLLGAVFAFVYRPMSRLWELKEIRHEVANAADKVHRFLDRIPEVGQAVGAKFLDPLSRSIMFENVTYSMPGLTGKRILDQLELKIPAGGMTVIASSNPLEARALLYMLPRFLEPQEGRVLIDGEDIAWVTLESLRAETLYVGGPEMYFTGTILENLTCGNDDYAASDAINAAKRVHAHNFIQKLPQGYQTILGEHGEQLTPGEAYRLGLARALLRNPALLLLEEPDQNLTEEDKSLIDDAYEQLQEGRTVIVIPSRMSTIRRSSRIVLLYQGKVATINTHANLLAGNELYRHWEYTRFNIFRKLNQPAT
ncbi:MAG: ABC transporter ATP-binding protein [Planctomycetaceae bacterium]|nr:ABC transporter ATP-binding protein [Planctomycetaceae bacterium]